MAAIASYKAVPSMLIVAPIGSTKRETRGSTPFFVSRQSIVTGRVAELQFAVSRYHGSVENNDVEKSLYRILP